MDTTNRVLSANSFNSKVFEERKKKLEQSMSARKEAMQLKRMQRTPKFNAESAARTFTGETTHSSSESTSKERQLEAFAGWINHLVGASLYDTTELEALQAKTKAEANKCLRQLLQARGGGTTTTPSEDEALGSSMKMDELRARATEMFDESPYLREIELLVQRHDIAVRADRKVYSDIGLQTGILQLYLSFNPLWLQLGLEVVTGKRLKVAGRFIPAVTRFIAEHILTDRNIMSSSKCAVGASRKIITPHGAELLHMNFIAKTCYFLVAVDFMRSSNMVPQVKCLFLKNSSFKCLADVYSWLSRELLTGSTNLPKMMKRIVGFVSTFKQGFFEEFNYTVGKNVASDLADGMVLGKVVEIVAGFEPDEVAGILRNPEGDRLRKIANVKAVLSMARQRISIPEVKPEKIVGGCIETLLEVLWSIVGIYKTKEAPTNSGAENDLEQFSIQQRSEVALQLLLHDNMKVRVLSASLLAGFVATSPCCAEYVAEKDGVAIILDAMDNLNRGICTDEGVHRLFSILAVLTKSESPLVINKLRENAEDIVTSTFHHMFVRVKSANVLSACRDVIVGLREHSLLRIEAIKKVDYQRKKLEEQMEKLLVDDIRRGIIGEAISLGDF